MLEIEQAIRERAYQLWIEGGCQDGYADAHWLAAQCEMLSVSLGEIGRVTVAGTPAKAIKTKARPKKLRVALADRSSGSHA